MRLCAMRTRRASLHCMVAILVPGSFSCSLDSELYCAGVQRGVLRASNGVASCIGYHADHLELQFPCDVPGSLMCSANQSAHN